MVEIVLSLVCAFREGDFELHQCYP